MGGLGISLTQSTGITADETASSAPQTAPIGPRRWAYDGIIPSGIPLVAGAATTVHGVPPTPPGWSESAPQA